MITGKAKIAGVVGWPISHSISPQLHGYWLDQHNIDGAMIPLAVRPEEFENSIRVFQRVGFKGVNVTIPHKEAAFRLADRRDGSANFSHTANLLIFHEDGSIEGQNTDSFGIFSSLSVELGPDFIRGRNVVVIGAGGAAKAVAFALHLPLGAARIHILNRNINRAKQLISELSPHMHADIKDEVETSLIPGTLEDWPRAASEASLVINATSAGMIGNAPLPIDLAPLSAHAAVCDIVYNPLETDLLKKAKAEGRKTIDGLGMLIAQAFPSFEAFFGVLPEIGNVREILVKTLNERGR